MANGDHPAQPAGSSLAARIWAAFVGESIEQKFQVALLILISTAIGALIPKANDTAQVILAAGLVIGILALFVTQPLLTMWKLRQYQTQADDRVCGLLPGHGQDPISLPELLQLLGVDQNHPQFPFVQQAIGNLVWYDRAEMVLIVRVPHYRYLPD